MKKLLISLLSLLLTFSLLMPIVAEDNQSNSSTTDSQTSEQTKPEEPSTGDIVWKEGMTVEYDGEQYAKLTEALTAVYKAGPHSQNNPAILNCKKDADVGSMTHGHVADSIIINGNGATVTSGEHDLEIDTWKFSRETGNQDNTNGIYLDQDITITINELNGISAWGQRHTNHTINLEFNNCQNMNRVYFNGQTGDINIKLDNCSFDADGYANDDTTIYSNANGKIEVSNTTFNGIDVAFNLNHKMQGEQEISITNCEFIDCGKGKKTENSDNRTYAAPIRVVAQVGTTSKLNVDNCTFEYTEGSESSNGDILLGDGRIDGNESGTISANVTNTNATIERQTKGYYNSKNFDDGVDKDKISVDSVTSNQKYSINLTGNPIEGKPTIENSQQGESTKPDHNWVYRPSYNDSKDEEVKEYTTEDKTKACIELLGKGWEYSEKNKSCVYTLDTNTQQIPNTSTR